jgi:ribonuclease E
MSKQEMLINYVPGEECRIAVVEDGRLEEIYQERASTESHVGNIYKGRVTNVEPSIQAAFIDFGLERNGFLHITDVHPKYFPGDAHEDTEQVGLKTPRRDRPPIQRCFRRGQEILVQVLKEGIGTKGPTVTSYLSIPGRFLVMMPDMERLGVSRKVEDDDARREMRKILDDLKPPAGFGFIIRTAGIGQSKTELKRDLAYLTRLWKSLEQRRKSTSRVGELYAESDLVIRTLRDVYTSDIERIVIDNEAAARRAFEYLAIASPRSAPNVLLYKDPIPLFSRHGIEQQIENINARTVPLPSGGYLVIDSTEALVAIDVNSGKSRDHSDAEVMAFRTNQEAVDEICRQLRLRDLGGVIVNDLIDMRALRHRREIEGRFRDNLKKDRAKTKASMISPFGLLEMTRQRMRPSLRKSIYTDCAICKGQGELKTSESVVLDVMRRLALVLYRQGVDRVELTVSGEVAFQLLNRKRDQLVALEQRYGKSVMVRVYEGGGIDYVTLAAFDNRGGPLDAEVLGRLPEPIVEQITGSSLGVDLTDDEPQEEEAEEQDRTDNRAGAGRDDDRDSSDQQGSNDDDQQNNDNNGAQQNRNAGTSDTGTGGNAGANNAEQPGEGGQRRRRRRRRGRRGRGGQGNGQGFDPQQPRPQPGEPGYEEYMAQQGSEGDNGDDQQGDDDSRDQTGDEARSADLTQTWAGEARALGGERSDDQPRTFDTESESSHEHEAHSHEVDLVTTHGHPDGRPPSLLTDDTTPADEAELPPPGDDGAGTYMPDEPEAETRASSSDGDNNEDTSGNEWEPGSDDDSDGDDDESSAGGSGNSGQNQGPNQGPNQPGDGTDGDGAPKRRRRRRGGRRRRGRGGAGGAEGASANNAGGPSSGPVGPLSGPVNSGGNSGQRGGGGGGRPMQQPQGQNRNPAPQQQSRPQPQQPQQRLPQQRPAQQPTPPVTRTVENAGGSGQGQGSAPRPAGLNRAVKPVYQSHTSVQVPLPGRRPAAQPGRPQRNRPKPPNINPQTGQPIERTVIERPGLDAPAATQAPTQSGAVSRGYHRVPAAPAAPPSAKSSETSESTGDAS